MAWLSSEARGGLRYGVLGLAATAAALSISSDAADARHHRRAHVHHVHYARHAYHHRHARAESYSPPSASIVVDGNSGAVLQASNSDALRHPASLTKVMTLYLLFERLEAGKVRLDTPLKVSTHASEQAPTKLGLKPGQTIAVEDAIKGIVTKSANDAAVAVAENLGGDEETFARLMTRKARALGMTRTTYVNASGLPDDDQITTARDQALLGRAIQERFPRYYKYFSTPSFVYHGEAMRNHNHLLGSIEGVDGIKTGFTRASGFNLLTSVHRDGRYIVAVVMGGHSSFARDAHMRELISAHIREAALKRTVPAIAEDRREEPVAFAKAPMASHVDPTRTAAANARAAAAGANDPIRPLLVRTITFRTAPVQSAALAPMPALVPAAAPVPSAQQAVVRPSSAEQPRTVVASAEPVQAAPQAGPAPAREIAPRTEAAAPAKMQPIVAPTKVEVIKPESAAKSKTNFPSGPLHAHGGWLIQIGAFDAETEAKLHLTAAQSQVHGALAMADPFTERVQKGDKTLYRARFAGFDKVTAEAACKQLKRSDFECMALKD